MQKNREQAGDEGYINAGRRTYGEGYQGDVDKASPLFQGLHYKGRLDDLIEKQRSQSSDR